VWRFLIKKEYRFPVVATLLIFGLSILLGLVLGQDSFISATEVAVVGENLEWSLVESPLTGKCYEVAWMDSGNVIGMAPVPCP
jgi:hypothetical protein